MGFLKVVADGSHMVMIECPDLVNILLHEFILWEPPPPPPPKKDSKSRPETAKGARAPLDLSIARPTTADWTAKTGGQR